MKLRFRLGPVTQKPMVLEPAIYLTLNPLKCKYLVCSRKIQLYSWADTNILSFFTLPAYARIYACQLWDPYTSKSWLSLEAVQKFACKVCLKMWDLDYNTMLQLLNLPPLSVRREYLKITAMYTIIFKMAIHTTLLEFLCKVITVTTLVNQVMLIL